MGHPQGLSPLPLGFPLSLGLPRTVLAELPPQALFKAQECGVENNAAEGPHWAAKAQGHISLCPQISRPSGRSSYPDTLCIYYLFSQFSLSKETP